MANRESAISEVDLLKIIRLIRSDELTIQEIARQTRYSRSVIASIKRRIDVSRRRVNRYPDK